MPEHHSMKPLELISANLTKGENVSINIEIRSLSLTKTISFNYLTTVIISGDQTSAAAIINCNSKTGIIFKSVKNITLTNLKLQYCGAMVTMKSKYYDYIDLL